jgi:bud site selection protein 20
LIEKSDELLNQEVDLEAPGFAQHYCLHCAKHFINQRALDDHFKTKVHKRRMKALQDDPYTQEEAEIAAGHGSFKKTPAKRKMETQPSKEEYSAGKRVKIDYYTPEELEAMKKKNRKSLNSSKNAGVDEEMKE